MRVTMKNARLFGGPLDGALILVQDEQRSLVVAAAAFEDGDRVLVVEPEDPAGPLGRPVVYRLARASSDGSDLLFEYEGGAR